MNTYVIFALTVTACFGMPMPTPSSIKPNQASIVPFGQYSETHNILFRSNDFSDSNSDEETNESSDGENVKSYKDSASFERAKREVIWAGCPKGQIYLSATGKCEIDCERFPQLEECDNLYG